MNCWPASHRPWNYISRRRVINLGNVFTRIIIRHQIEMEYNMRTVAVLAAIILMTLMMSANAQDISARKARYFVATSGDDNSEGSEQRPFATLARAREAVRSVRGNTKGPIVVLVREGTYYQDEPFTLGPKDSGTEAAPVIYAAYGDERVTISGGVKLDCNWRSYKNGIMMCALPSVNRGDLEFTQLFVNGRRQHRAQFPNYDNAEPGKTGYVWPAGRIEGREDSSDVKRVLRIDANADMTQNDEPPRGIVYDPDTFTKKRWAKPKEAIIHIYQDEHWGNLQWTLSDVDYKKHEIWFGMGGHQIGAKWNSGPISVNAKSQYYIENVFEELDAPGEWYLDKDKGTLYYLPAKDVDLNTALVEAPVLQRLVQFKGSQYDPVRHIHLSGFRVAHTESTFMEPYWIPSGSDWSIHRGGTVFMEGARDCTVENCFFDAVGGNAVFMNNYNRNNVVTGCTFTEAGDSAICFVGSLEFTNGTHKAFPYECKSVNNLIHDCGIFGKQVAGAYISRAKRITVSHNLIYNMPRAGICIGDGTWGGHLIEFNDVHHCIRETWDHGPFNAWGREAYWCLSHSHGEKWFKAPHPPGKVKVWAMEPVIIRNNYWHGNVGYLDDGYRQGIDIDDGSSNFHIYNNVCKGMALSIREGAYRTVENNIIINPVVPLGVHVGYMDSHDIIRRNIIVTDNSVYYMNHTPEEHPVLEEINYNIFWQPSPGWGQRTVITRRPRGGKVEKYSLAQWQKLGYDTDSIVKDPKFVDLEGGNYRLRPGSPALELGFKNIDQSWGLTDKFPQMWRE